MNFPRSLGFHFCLLAIVSVGLWALIIRFVSTIIERVIQ